MEVKLKKNSKYFQMSYKLRGIRPQLGLELKG